MVIVSPATAGIGISTTRPGAIHGVSRPPNPPDCDCGERSLTGLIVRGNLTKGHPEGSSSGWRTRLVNRGVQAGIEPPTTGSCRAVHICLPGGAERVDLADRRGVRGRVRRPR